MTRRRKKEKKTNKNFFSFFPKEHRMTQLTHASTKRYARSKDGSLCCYRTVSLCFILSLPLFVDVQKIPAKAKEKLTARFVFYL